MSAKLDPDAAAGYIVDLKTSAARRECIRFWEKTHGTGYAQGVLAMLKKRHPKTDFGIVL